MRLIVDIDLYRGVVLEETQTETILISDLTESETDQLDWETRSDADCERTVSRYYK